LPPLSDEILFIPPIWSSEALVAFSTLRDNLVGSNMRCYVELP